MNTDLLMSYPRIVWCWIVCHWIVCHHHNNNLIESVVMAVLTFADQALLCQSLLAYCTTLCLFEGLNLEGVGMDSLKVFWLKGGREGGGERESEHSISWTRFIRVITFLDHVSLFYGSDIFKPHTNFTANF